MSASRDILLIDDHAELREATRDLLEALGHRVTVTASGEDLDLTGGIDVVVTSDAGSTERLLDAGVGVVLLTDGPAVDDRFGGRSRLLRKPFSAGELRAAVERAASIRAVPRRASSRRASSRRRSLATMWGAAAAALVVASLVALRSAELGAPALPEPTAGTVSRGAAIELMAPTGEVAMPAAFAWSPVPGAASYHVRVTGVDGATVWEGAATVDELPASADLHAGVVYSWEVEAFDAAGRKLAASARARFRVTPAGERERNE